MLSLTVKADAGRHRRHHLTDEAIEVAVARTLDVQLYHRSTPYDRG